MILVFILGFALGATCATVALLLLAQRLLGEQFTFNARYNSFVVASPDIMNGAFCIRGTRIPIYIIIEKLGAGRSIDSILQDYPHITREQIVESVVFAADMLESARVSRKWRLVAEALRRR